MLAGLLAALRARLPEALVAVLSADPQATTRMHGVSALPRGPAEIWRALRGARMLVCGGGSLVQDVTSARSALYYLGAMQAASWRRVPVAVIGQGIGPLRRAWIRRLAGRAFSQARVISVRDAESAQTLRELGVRPVVHLGADLALLAPAADPGQVQERIRREGLDRAPIRIGVATRAWPGMREPEELGRGIGRFADMVGARVAIFPFDRSRDGEISRTVARAAAGRVVEVETPAELMGLVAAMDLMVAVRLHGLIFAAAGGVPAVALAYDPKVTAFAAEIGLPGPLPVDCTGLGLAEAIARAWDGRASLRSRAQAAYPGLRSRALASVDLLASVLNGRA